MTGSAPTPQAMTLEEAREHLVMRLEVGANVVEKLGPGDVLWSEKSRRTLVELLRESATALEPPEPRDDTAELVEAAEAALHDLVTSEGLYACDNEEGHSLFRLEQPSATRLRAALAKWKERQP